MATFSFTQTMTYKLESIKIIKTCMRKARNGPSSNFNLGYGETATDVQGESFFDFFQKLICYK